MANGVRKLVEEFNRAERKEKRAKHSRTLSLDTKHFLELQEYCKERNVSVSEVIDRLMEEFLAEALNATPEEDDADSDERDTRGRGKNSKRVS